MHCLAITSRREGDPSSNDDQPTDFDSSENYSEMARMQRSDPALQPLIHFLTSGELPPEDDAARRILLEYHRYELFPDKTGPLYRLDPVGRPAQKAWRLVIPSSAQSELLYSHHDDPLGGHAGISRMFSRLAKTYYWELGRHVPRRCRSLPSLSRVQHAQDWTETAARSPLVSSAM